MLMGCWIGCVRWFVHGDNPPRKQIWQTHYRFVCPICSGAGPCPPFSKGGGVRNVDFFIHYQT